MRSSQRMKLIWNKVQCIFIIASLPITQPTSYSSFFRTCSCFYINLLTERRFRTFLPITVTNCFFPCTLRHLLLCIQNLLFIHTFSWFSQTLANLISSLQNHFLLLNSVVYRQSQLRKKKLSLQCITTPNLQMCYFQAETDIARKIRMMKNKIQKYTCHWLVSPKAT